MMTLYDSPRFQEEKRNYEEMINGLQSAHAKAEIQELLNKLISAVRQIDMYHEKLGPGNDQAQIPSQMGDSREKIVELRKKLDRRLKDFKRLS